MFNFLINNKANINARSNSFNTPLSMALLLFFDQNKPDKTKILKMLKTLLSHHSNKYLIASHQIPIIKLLHKYKAIQRESVNTN